MPTPDGVPVKIRSRGYSGQIDERYATRVGIGENQLGRASGLHSFAANVAPQPHVIAIVERVGRYDGRPRGPVVGKALAEAELRRHSRHLHRAVRDILAEHKTGDDAPCLELADVCRCIADHGDDLDLPVDHVPRQRDLGGRSGDAARELREREWRGRQGRTRLTRMVAVVQADTEHLDAVSIRARRARTRGSVRRQSPLHTGHGARANHGGGKQRGGDRPSSDHRRARQGRTSGRCAPALLVRQR